MGLELQPVDQLEVKGWSGQDTLMGLELQLV